MRLFEVEQNFELFSDLDGVMADFLKAVYELTGKLFGEMPLKDFWRMAYRAQEIKPAIFPNGFYGSMDFLPGGQEYWNGIKKYNPIVLTGIPYGNWAPKQKVEWIHRHLHTNRIITCLAREKPQKATEYLGRTNLDNCILIDDNALNIKQWQAAGGIGLQYFNAEQALADLETLIKTL
jgi:5' nucleotidase, deoxy (Pyrimidine), cytosolic type C protein (NT5C)